MHNRDDKKLAWLLVQILVWKVAVYGMSNTLGTRVCGVTYSMNI